MSSLTVAVVGVLGTLTSGLLTHRSALRSKTIELDYTQKQRQEEQAAADRREALGERRATYSVFNQRLRQFHSILSRHLLDLESDRLNPQHGQEREEPRRVLRDVYAEAQMVVSDDVLVAGGNLVRKLHSIHFLLREHEQGGEAGETLEEIRARLEQASEALYEVRQTMRRDLGITELPIRRPDHHDMK